MFDPSILDRIAGACDDNRPVLEIGPGPGGLTRALLAEGHRVRAVELDRDMIEGLRQLQGLEIVQGDALRLPLEELVPGPGWQVCSNLPYNAGTAILLRLLLETDVDPMVLMFQREVAERLGAAPRTADYGSLSVTVQAIAHVKRLFDLPPGAFRPPPKVWSSVVQLRRRAEPITGGLPRERFERAVRAGFSQRRKTLENSLSAVYGKEAARAALGAWQGRRAEELGVEEWAELASRLENPA